MARIVFTANIQRHVACPAAEAGGRTVREVLENVFEENPQARGYVLDDQAALRKHMAIFVDGQIGPARLRLHDRRPLGECGPGRQLGLRYAHPTANLFGAVRMTWRRWQFAASNEVLHGYDNTK